MIVNLICLVLVSLLWGATNPFIRVGSKGIDRIQSGSKLLQIFLELKFLIINWKYMIPFTINQCGSLLYIYALQNVNLSLAVPVANSLSFIFTALMAHLLGEDVATRNTYLGAIFITIGSTLCLLDKI